MPSEDRLPWFPFYARDWLDAKVLSMTLEEQGAYFRILVHCWADSKDQASIPSDPTYLAQLLGVSRTRINKIKQSFDKNTRQLFDLSEPGIMRSLKLLEIKKAAASLKGKRSLAGKAGARSRWSSHQGAMPVAIDLPLASGMAKDGYVHCTGTKDKREALSPLSEGTYVPETLMEIAVNQTRIPNKTETIAKWINAWVHRPGVGGVEGVKRILLDEGAVGLTVTTLDDHYFKTEPDAKILVKQALKGDHQ